VRPRSRIKPAHRSCSLRESPGPTATDLSESRDVWMRQRLNYPDISLLLTESRRRGRSVRAELMPRSTTRLIEIPQISCPFNFPHESANHSRITSACVCARRSPRTKNADPGPATTRQKTPTPSPAGASPQQQDPASPQQQDPASPQQQDPASPQHQPQKRRPLDPRARARNTKTKRARNNKTKTKNLPTRCSCLVVTRGMKGCYP
jgi:hypothetical protein